jgi:hypothetical protein
MKRRFVDMTVFESRNMVADGNTDFKFWFDKSIEDRLRASCIMTSVAFREPNFLNKKVDRTQFSNRKHTI